MATTERMGVDPLAAMDRAAREYIGLRDADDANSNPDGGAAWDKLRAEMRDARAAVAELVAADMLLDKCDAALEQHRVAKTYTEAWAATQLELWRSRDLAAKRRAAALAPFSEAGR